MAGKCHLRTHAAQQRAPSFQLARRHGRVARLARRGGASRWSVAVALVIVRPPRDLSDSHPTPPDGPRSRVLVEAVADGSLGSVPVGIRISVRASEGADEGPHDVDQLGDELIELGIPKLELKRTNDVPDLLIQIEDRGFGDLTT